MLGNRGNSWKTTGRDYMEGDVLSGKDAEGREEGEDVGIYVK
jgi:hypothetical protein